MAVEYNVYIYNSAGILQGLASDFGSVQVAKVVNGYDTLGITVPYTSPLQQYLVTGSRIEVYRANLDIGIPLTLEFSGAVVKTTFKYGRQKLWDVVAFGWEYILSYRIIAYNEDKQNHSEWVGKAASTIINDILVKNLGTDSVTVGITDRAVSGLITGVSATTTGLGNVLTVSDMSYKNVLSAIQEVALQGNVDFEFLWDKGTGGLDFNVGSPTLAYDRSGTVTLSVDNGTINNFSRVIDETQLFTQAIVRGQGTANATIRVVRPATPLTELSSREAFFDVSTAGNNIAFLNSYGDAKLQEMAKKVESVQIDVQQTPSTLYGVHYSIGDLVSVDLVTEIVVMQVNAVTLSMDESGVETVKVQLEYAN